MWPETYDFRYHEIVKQWVILPILRMPTVYHILSINKDITSPSEVTFDLKVSWHVHLLAIAAKHYEAQ